MPAHEDPRPEARASGSPAEEVPLAIGGFPVVRLLGEGGMGRVYACRDEKLDRLVAVKMLRHDLARQPSLVERFLREARAMARIASPHVVTVHSVGEEGGTPFLVMEMLEGEDLHVRVQRRGPLIEEDALRFVRDAVVGLSDAAAAGIIHRDVKPANLFVVEGRVKLTDFGLARPVDADARLTQDGLVVGTPHYLAPEAARGQVADEVSDIYALGATLFEVLAAHPPYPGQAALDVVSAHLTKPVPSIRKERADVHPEVDRLIQSMMAKERANRFKDYPSLLRAIDDVLERVLAARRGADPPSPTPRTGTTPAVRNSSPGVQVKTATLTVMFTDIAGYTERTGQQSREEAARWLAVHDALLQPILRAFGGRLVKTIGDALLATFSSPTDAVLCGTAIQDRLFLHNRGAAESDRIHVRVALSAGEVRVHKGDVLGEPVNLAARLEALAEPGQVLLSDAVFATMNVAEVPVEAIGEHSFKGIQRPVQVYRAVPSGPAGELPFGGRALERAEERAGTLEEVADRAARGLGQLSAGVQKKLQEALGTSRVSAFDNVLGSLRGAFSRVGPREQRALLSFVALALVVIIGVMVGKRIIGGREMTPEKARAAIAEVEAVPPEARAGRDELRRGHAHAALGQKDEALRAFRAALKKGAHDEKTLRYALALLEEQDGEKAVDLLAEWPADISGRLLPLLDGPWWPRHHALRVLEKRNLASDDHRQKVALEDLRSGETCAQRRYGLLLLRRAGRGEEALQAVREAGRRMPDNLCMALDLQAVERAIGGR